MDAGDDWNENLAYLAFLPCLLIFISFYFCVRAMIDFRREQLHDGNFNRVMSTRRDAIQSKWKVTISKMSERRDTNDQIL